MTEPRRNRPKWIFWVLAIAALGYLIWILTHIAVTTSPPHRNIIHDVAAGLEAFKQDWGMYPPSSNGTEGARGFGYQCLALYLMGPDGKGWGQPANGVTPFGGKSERQFGPYYADDRGNQNGPPEAILDSFKPAKPLLYFRFDRDRDPPYDVRDNPVDPTCVNGFASQEHFELLVRPKDPNGNRKWVREDYLLISPGPDRCYGYVAEDRATGKLRPARPEEIEKGEAFCDDITNIRH